MKEENFAIALLLHNKRFYAGKSKAGRMQTAWALAGSELFGAWMKTEIESAEKFIKSRGYSCQQVIVAMLFKREKNLLKQNLSSSPRYEVQIDEHSIDIICKN